MTSHSQAKSTNCTMRKIYYTRETYEERARERWSLSVSVRKSIRMNVSSTTSITCTFRVGTKIEKEEAK